MFLKEKKSNLGEDYRGNSAVAVLKAGPHGTAPQHKHTTDRRRLEAEYISSGARHFVGNMDFGHGSSALSFQLLGFSHVDQERELDSSIVL